MRGTPRLLDIDLDVSRITPACAGNTSYPDATVCSTSDHPRLCGEHLVRYLEVAENDGSPPPVRGTLRGPPRSPQRHRITPACAGNTILTFIGIHCFWDHPRLCGEHWYPIPVYSPISGSPPPVRGTQPEENQDINMCRITPACAGNTLCGHQRRRGLPDHPRLCGEHDCRPCAAKRPRGSPPPVRGTRMNKARCSCQCRITPACAGNTQERCRDL